MFQRNNFYRLKKGTLQDDNIEIIVKWMEETHDNNIRARLLPDAIFEEVGKTVRDYYFHIPASNDIDEWNEQILEQFSGIYWCAPSWDMNNFVPLPVLRKWFEDHRSYPQLGLEKRTLNVQNYIATRSILILRNTGNSYFHAAEFPLSVLFPRTFKVGCVKLSYEGVGYVSANSIHVHLRECLSRVPKSHAFTIKETPKDGPWKPAVLPLHIPSDSRDIRKEWERLPQSDMDHLAKQYALSIEEDYHFEGSAQITGSPVPILKNRVGLTTSSPQIYHRKPRDFIHNRDAHLLYPELDITEQIEKILDNPLVIGELL